MIRFFKTLLCFLAITSVYSQAEVGEVSPHAPHDLIGLQTIHGKSFRRAGLLHIGQSYLVEFKATMQRNDTLLLHLFNDYQIVAVKESRIKQTTNGYYWRGNLIEGGEGYIDLYLRKGLLSGTVYTAHEVYKLDAINNSTVRVVELNPEEDSKFECHTPNERHIDHIEKPKSVLSTTTPPKQETKPASKITVDVMVIYPQSIENLMGGPAGMENEVNYRIEEANQVFANSLINVELRLVHHQVETSVSADAQGAGDVRTTQVEALRAVHKADLVSFWSANGSAGSGFNFEGTGNPSTGFNTSKFSLVQTYYTFIHEIGHNMGAKHDRQTYYESSPTSSKLNVTPYYRYGKSFVGYRSIMSYSSCNDLPGGSSNDCERVPYMTNPDIIVNGAPFGVPGDFQTYAVNGPANNARRINETAAYIADYFDGDPVETYDLVVNNGTGSGSYSEGATVTITADAAAQGKTFDRWIGDVNYINDVFSSIANVTVPNMGVSLTATYKTIDYTNGVTITVPVVEGDDDVEESGDGTANMYMTSSDLELTEDGSKGNQTIGIRFQNLQIPKGMEIESASISFIADESGSGATSLLITADENTNAASFSTTAGDVSRRTLTAKSKIWSPSAWTVEQSYNSPDLAELLQEIISKDEWSFGNAVAFIITGTGGRSAYAYDGDVTKAPVLNVVFKTATNNPVVENPINDQSLCQGFGSYTIDLKDVFDDVETSDNDLVYSSSTSTDVSVSLANGIATISSISGKYGQSTIVFTATDQSGKSISDEVLYRVAQSYQVNESKTMCFGDTYQFGSQTLTSSGEYEETFTAVSGCDSIVTLTLTELPKKINSVNRSICAGSIYQFGTQTLTVSGIYTEDFVSNNGCDSTVYLTLEVVNAITSNQTIEICYGEMYVFGNQNLTQTGVYNQTFTSENGCDSIVTLQFTVLPEIETAVDAYICFAGSYTFGNQVLTTAGTYTEIFTSTLGCDSTVVLTLSVVSQLSSEQSITLCFGETYPFGSQVLGSTGTYQESFTSVSGCDSVVSLNLTVLPENKSSITERIKTGEVFVFGTDELMGEGVYTKVFISGNGCDSTVTLTLELENNDPQVVNEIVDQVLEQNFDPFTIDLTQVFTDVESSGLIYTTAGNTNIIIEIDVNGIATISSTSNWIGTETVVFIATDGEGATVKDEVKFIVDLPASIFSVNNELINIYPNPTTDWVIVEKHSDEIILVYSELGEQMQVRVENNKVDLSGLSSGLYIIKVGERYSKVIKE